MISNKSQRLVLTLILTAAITILAISAVELLAQSMSPAGLWQANDSKTGKPKALIRITEDNGKLTGKTEKLFKGPGEDPNPKCDKCEGDKKNQPIIGMVMLWDLKKDGNEYSGGRILDPDDGKTYKAKIEIVDGGKKLKMRGYMGFAMIGKTEYWTRVE